MEQIVTNETTCLKMSEHLEHRDVPNKKHKKKKTNCGHDQKVFLESSGLFRTNSGAKSLIMMRDSPSGLITQVHIYIYIYVHYIHILCIYNIIYPI